ncbi:MAG: hypothetical protein HWN81_23610 [Candidatus Lokiarchaeota archaeon]|nr:hypothetical protein [Candidatus Lokiarchaeota archaeon]
MHLRTNLLTTLIGTIHDEDHMKYLFNALRDYIQTEDVSWILVGDVGLRRFIAQEVDRLDDIISYEIDLLPLIVKARINSIDKARENSIDKARDYISKKGLKLG